MSDSNNWLTGNHHRLADINHRSLRQALGNRALNYVGLLIGTTDTSTVDYDAFDFLIGGRAYEQAGGTTAALAVLDYYGDTVVQAAGTTCFYLVTVNAAGTENVIKGKDDEIVNLPGIPDTECLIGIIKIVTDATHTFTIGTDDFDGAGITDTFYDYIHAPTVAP